MNSVWPDMTYSTELEQKLKMLGKLIFKNILITQFLWNTVPWPYQGRAIVF